MKWPTTSVGLVEGRNAASTMRILAVPAAPCIKMNNEKIVMCLFYCLCHSAAPWEGRFGDTSPWTADKVRPSLSSCTQTACFIRLSLTYSLWPFTYRDNICIFEWRFCWKGITEALVLVTSRPTWLSCWFRDAIWSRESCIATIVTRRLLLKYSQSGWRSNKSSKSNAICLAGSLRASAQLYERDNTTLWFRVRECRPSLQQSIARWLHFKKYWVK
jgi:hypothetical protein